MLRLVGWFALVFVALHVLRLVPGVGRLFDIPIVGFWLAAFVVSAVAAFAATRIAVRRRFAKQIRALRATDTPHNRGKLGALLFATGRVREALPHLEVAARGEPERLEWRHREACARLALGDARGAASILRALVDADEDHAFGTSLLRLAEAELRSDDARASLAAAERFERARGTTAESAYRRGLALKKLSRPADARAALAEVADAAREAPRAGRGEARGFAWRAFWARWL